MEQHYGLLSGYSGGLTLPLFFTKNVTGAALEIVPGTLYLLNTVGEVRDGDRVILAKSREVA